MSSTTASAPRLRPVVTARPVGDPARRVGSRLRAHPGSWLPGELLMDGETRFEIRLKLAGIVPLRVETAVVGAVVDARVVARGVELRFGRRERVLGSLHGELTAVPADDLTVLEFRGAWSPPHGVLPRLVGRALIGLVLGAFVGGAARRLSSAAFVATSS